MRRGVKNMNEQNEAEPGVLYLVGTPIGNLGDLSPRAASILSSVDLVAAEDTRRTLRLLNHLGLRKHLESYHEHNRLSKTAVLTGYLQQGRSIALVSDAGMPCISDPGYELVRECASLGIKVTAIPGPCAAIVALSGAGLLSDRFVFEGFLPVQAKIRKNRLAELTAEPRTTVLYEAPHRLVRTLTDLAASGLGDRQLTLARELTKRHEEFLRMTVSRALDYYAQHEPRGEYVLVLEGLSAYSQYQATGEKTAGVEAGAAAGQLQAELRDCRQRGLSMKDAVRECVSRGNRKKNIVYQAALEEYNDQQNDAKHLRQRGRPS
jgi:16S rRNA (cytidine1402-2'-O)-methyltransferase